MLERVETASHQGKQAHTCSWQENVVRALPRPSPKWRQWRPGQKWLIRVRKEWRI
jgi:hypothetical protein